MSDTLFDMTPYKSEATQSYRSDWTDAIGSDPSWDEPNSEPKSEANTKDPSDYVPDVWQSAAEFTIALKSGRDIEVKFVPGLEGELRMHSFTFTGSISPTGFKSHFVLALEAEEFPHPRDYAQAYVEELLVQLAQKPHQPKKISLTRDHLGAEAPQGRTPDNDNSKHEPAMRENKTTDSSHVPVEVVEELSPDEAADRQRLELLVERAFSQAGSGLRELRDRRLYRSTHKTFEEYCQDRFGFTRYAAYYKIAASEVLDNLLTKSQQNSPTRNHQILPTKETQVRPLAKLDPEEQRLVWQQAVERAGGKVPSERIVKDAVLHHKGSIVDRLKQKNPPPPEFALGDVVEIKAVKGSPLRPFNGMCGMIEHVGSFSYTVRLGIASDTQQCKQEEVAMVDDEYTADIKVVSQRIAALVKFELEPIEYDLLANLQRSKCFTPTQLQLLEWLEHKHLAA